MITIQIEQRGDIAAIRAINEVAFGQPTEDNIVDSLRNSCPDAVSLVAVEDEKILGHIFFSPIFVFAGSEVIQGMGLAPMAVLPGRQRQGIGSILVEAGIEAMRERKCPFIIVLGHPEYYPRFEFVPASHHGLSCQWNGVPNEAFMVLILEESAMEGVSGVAKYRDEFNQAT
ncbi:MAG: N-acetyltransferase [candidate division Zixibacteria bacterium]|nr:N-acetyltransferase [candidate division Zixibacteria bacterium]